MNYSKYKSLVEESYANYLSPKQRKNLLRSKKDIINLLEGEDDEDIIESINDHVDEVANKISYYCNIEDAPQVENYLLVSRFCVDESDFQELYQNSDICSILNDIDPDNFKELLKLCRDIKDLKIVFSSESLVEILDLVKAENLKHIVSLCNTIQEFKIFSKHPKLYEILKFAKSENLKLIVLLCKSNGDTKLLFESSSIHSILQSVNPLNLKSVISLCGNLGNLIKICSERNIRELLKLANPDKFKEVASSSRNIEDLIHLGNVLYQFLCLNVDVKGLKIKDIIHQYLQISNNDSSWEEIGDSSKSVIQYKLFGNNPYVGDTEVLGPLSLLNLEVKSATCKYGSGGNKIDIQEGLFYEVNNKFCPLGQQAVNRVFSPYLSMSRLIKIKDTNEEKIVSVNVHDENAENILKHTPESPEIMLLFLRLIYQFIAKDGDRRKGHNLENGIIFDHDYIMKNESYIKDLDTSIFWSKFSHEQKIELAEILYFFREYIIKYCTEALEEEGLEEKVIYVYKNLMGQAKKLTAINLGLGTWSEPKDIPIMVEVDRLLAEKYKK